MLRFVSSKKKKRIALLAEEAASLGLHCDDNEGKMETEGDGWREPRARLERAACVVEQMGLRVARPCVPQSSSAVPSPRSRGSRRRTFGVFVLASPGVVGFLRRSLDSVELFSTRPVCCAAPVLLCTGPVSSTEGCILESCCQEVQLTGSFFVCGLSISL